MFACLYKKVSICVHMCVSKNETEKSKGSVFMCVRRRIVERVKSLIPGIEDGKLSH